jgi:hypothetical protein
MPVKNIKVMYNYKVTLQYADVELGKKSSGLLFV